MTYRLFMKKVMVAALCAVLPCFLAGCQLALENAGPNANRDRLVGVYVTTEYLDLFDFDSYMNDNFNDFTHESEVVIDGRPQEYEGRIYAELVTKTVVNDETGEAVEQEDFVFEGIEGAGYYAATIPATADHESYYGVMNDGDLTSEITSNINVGDEGIATTMEGTFYVSPGSETTFYFNPVYQGSDGRVYLVSGGGGFLVSDAVYDEGALYTETMDEVYTTAENGKVRTDSISIKTSIACIFAPENFTVIEMDRESEPLSRKEYKPGALPEALAPGAGTDYLIVEAYKQGPGGENITRRDLYGKDDSVIETFSARADRVCIKHETQIKWPK